MRQDVEFLAGHLPHRRAVTEGERSAAEYIRERLGAYIQDVAIDDFYSIESYAYVFASYYAEFLVVALIAWWFPWVALVYGLVVFVLYMAEFTAYPVLSRLLPHYETQNVVARALSPEPKRFLVVTAHYDSPVDSLVTRLRGSPWLGRLHALTVLAMVLVLVSCAAAALNVFAVSETPWELWLRWAGVGWLAVAAGVVLIGETRGEPMLGARHNAAGVAALLALAAALRDNPLRHVDVWLVATGAKEPWMQGMRRLLTGLDVDPDHTYFINIAHVGAGELRYEIGEGMLHLYPCAKELVGLAAHVAPMFRARPLAYRGFPTDTLVPLVRGYKAMGVMAAGPNGLPDGFSLDEDTPGSVDYELLSRAAGFVEAIVRRLDSPVS